MDVIVDANVICSDFTLRSTRFAGLFDYLKRTGSSLVIPDAVREEVLANYKRELKSRSKDARKAWDSLQGIVSKPAQCQFPNFEEEHTRLQERLQSPIRSVNIIGFRCELDALEIVRRGAHRVPPARDDGEELRDVIIWLTALRYAGYSGEVERRFRKEAERRSGTKVNSSRSEATLAG